VRVLPIFESALLYLFVRRALLYCAACTRSCSSNNKAVPDCGSDSELGSYLQRDLQHKRP
jgi:hypothetical protein